MQNEIVAEIESNVTYAFHAYLVIAGSICKEHQVAALKVGLFYRLALQDLVAGGNAQQHAVCTQIEYVLHKRRAVERGHREPAQFVTFSGPDDSYRNRL